MLKIRFLVVTVLLVVLWNQVDSLRSSSFRRVTKSVSWSRGVSDLNQIKSNSWTRVSETKGKGFGSPVAAEQSKGFKPTPSAATVEKKETPAPKAADSSDKDKSSFSNTSIPATPSSATGTVSVTEKAAKKTESPKIVTVPSSINTVEATSKPSDKPSDKTSSNQQPKAATSTQSATTTVKTESSTKATANSQSTIESAQKTNPGPVSLVSQQTKDDSTAPQASAGKAEPVEPSVEKSKPSPAAISTSTTATSSAVNSASKASSPAPAATQSGKDSPKATENAVSSSNKNHESTAKSSSTPRAGKDSEQSSVSSAAVNEPFTVSSGVPKEQPKESVKVSSVVNSSSIAPSDPEPKLSTIKVQESPSAKASESVKAVTQTAAPSVASAATMSSSPTPSTKEQSKEVTSTNVPVPPAAVPTASTSEASSITVEPIKSETTAQTTTDVEPVKNADPAPDKKVELSLQEKIVKQETDRQKRLEELTLLQGELSKSISKKTEMENLMIEELKQISNRLSAEMKSESTRVKQLEDLYDSFQGALLKRTALLESEKKVLQQMQNVRSQISEQAVLKQMDSAITKKSELIQIEDDICKEIVKCAKEINDEVQETTEKMITLTAAIESMPNIQDREAIRRYSWSELEKLNGQLLTSIKTSIQRDEKLDAFAVEYDAIMRRRGLVLGENTVIPSAVANTMQKISGTSSDKPVASTSSSSASSNPVASVLNDPKYSQFLPSERIALSETIADLKRKSDDELGSTAIEALTKSALSLWGAATSLFDASGKYFKSKDYKEANKALSMASNAASGAGSGFQNTFKNMKAAWDSEVRPEEPETTDEYIAALARGTKKVFTSDEVKKEIGSVASNTQKTLSEVGLAGSLFTKKINAELSSSEKWNSSVTELQANLKILAAVITVGTIKLVESSRGRELPPTK